jgi:2-methylcitrate dehydratase PrpD
MAELSPTRRLAELITATGYADIPEQQLVEAERAIVDCLSATTLGLLEPSSMAFRVLLKDAGRDDGVSVLDAETPRARLIDAVAYHAAVSHQVEFAPAVSRAVLHVNGIVLAALGVAEKTGASGAELLRAVVLGCEVAIRFGRSLSTDPARTERGDHPIAFLKGWWTPAMVTPIGIATAAVLLRGGTADQLHHAWGLAINLSPTSTIPLVLEGSTGKGVAMSGATNAGLIGADLALAGATGQEDIVGGWMPVIVDKYDPSFLGSGFPERYEFSFLLYKPYATVGPVFAPIDAALAVREAHPDLDPDAITDIEVFGYTRSLRFAGPVPPPTAEGGRGNLPYCVARALVYNDPGEFIVDAFTDDVLDDEVVTRLGRLVHTTFEPQFEAEYPLDSAKSRILVTLADGRVLEGLANRSVMAKYHDPPREESERKFDRAAVELPAQARRQVLDAVWGLAESADAGAPMRLLADAWTATHLVGAG